VSPARDSGEPDVVIGAAAKARRLRFRSKPRTKVRFKGRTQVRSDEEIEELDLESGSSSERRNLPEEVESGVTYRDVQVAWAGRARARMPEELAEGDTDAEGER
jgi:hypothetical protein